MSLLYPDNALTVIQGTTLILDIAVTFDGAPVNLSGAALYMTARVNPEDQLPVFFKQLGSGITITDTAGGLARITLNPADTNKALGVYLYDIVAVIPSGTYAGTHVIVPETVLEIKRGITRV